MPPISKWNCTCGDCYQGRLRPPSECGTPLPNPNAPSQQLNEVDIKKAVAEAIAEQLKPKPSAVVEEVSTEAMQPASSASTSVRHSGADEPQIVTMLSKIDSKQDKMDSRKTLA